MDCTDAALKNEFKGHREDESKFSLGSASVIQNTVIVGIEETDYNVAVDESRQVSLSATSHREDIVSTLETTNTPGKRFESSTQ